MITKRIFLAALMSAVAFATLSSLSRVASSADSSRAEFVELEGVIDPVSSRYLLRQIASAEEQGSAAVIVRLDTPGGLDVSMREMVKRILNSKVPVIVWVAPSGARAASAGVFIGYASHYLVMAPGTNIGAAHPVNLSGGSSDISTEKSTNDAAALIRGIAKERGRNVEWAEEAVRKSSSIDAAEAKKIGVIDEVVADTPGLLAALAGKSFEVRGKTVTLPEKFTLRFHKMQLLESLLHTAIRPEIAYMLILIGFYGLIFELYNPGIGAAGVLGGISLIFGFYALSVLPTSWAGVALILLAVVFFVADLHIAGLGVFTAGGVVALIAGSWLLFSQAGEQLRLPWLTIGLAVGITMIFFLSIMTAAVRARMAKPISGAEGIVGMIGTARTDIAPTGQVMARGTLWRAKTLGAAISQGAEVQIKGVSGLVLMVEPAQRPENSQAEVARTSNEESGNASRGGEEPA